MCASSCTASVSCLRFDLLFNFLLMWSLLEHRQYPLVLRMLTVSVSVTVTTCVFECDYLCV